MTPQRASRKCCINSVCYCRTPSQRGHRAQRKCLFSLTDLNAVWLSGASSVVLIQEMISPEDFAEKEVTRQTAFSFFFPLNPPVVPLVGVQGGLTTTVTNWPWCDWLCIESGALLPTKTHTSLDVTGTSLGTHTEALSVMIQLRAIMVFTRSCSLGRVSFNFFFFLLSAAYCKQTHPEGLQRVKIRGSFTRNLRVLPVFKLSAKQNKSFQCHTKKRDLNKD